MTTNYPGSLDSYTTKVDGVDDVLAAHVNNLQDAVVAIETYARAGSLKIVKNTSGGTVAANDVGYIDYAGEFKTTTTAYYSGAWAVVISGAATGSDIIVAQAGRVTVELNGNCSVGDYLYTSTTATRAQPLSYVRPEVFGVALTANAAGAGGTCSALLLCNRAYMGAAVDTTYFVVAHATFDFVATINGAPSGTSVVYNAPGSGNENTIEPYNSVDYNYKLVLANTTRGDDALIQDVNTGTNTITLTATAPGTWQNGDTISARSQTATGQLGAASYYYEIDVEDTIHPLATTIVQQLELSDSGGTGAYYAAANVVASPATEIVRNQATSIYNGLKVHTPLINGRFCLAAVATGAATLNTVTRQAGYFIASP